MNSMVDDSGWVVNASPLILFSRIGQLAWLERLAPALWVPDAVIKETASGRGFDPFAATAVAWAMRHRIGPVKK